MTTLNAESQILYVSRGDHYNLPKISFSEEDFDGSRQIFTLELRGLDGVNLHSNGLPGLAGMATHLEEDARALGVELKFHIALDPADRGFAVIITEGRLELLAAIKETLDGEHSYATRVLQRESIQFGGMLDLDLRYTIRRGRELRELKAAAASRLKLSHSNPVLTKLRTVPEGSRRDWVLVFLTLADSVSFAFRTGAEVDRAKAVLLRWYAIYGHQAQL